jgi:hypothetical protein
MRTPLAMTVALVAACGFEPSGDLEGDAAIDADPDGPVLDAATIDAATIDAAIIDAATIDAAIIDAAIIDAAIIDAAIIDAATIDAATIDAPTDAPTDAPVDAAACPGTYGAVVNGGRYRYVATPGLRVFAAADCDDDLAGRTHLATFETASDIDPVLSAINPGNSIDAFVGAACGAFDCSDMAAWSWDTGGAVAATAWELGQPDNGTTEKAGAVRRAMGTWHLHNTTATSTLPYVCECDP